MSERKIYKSDEVVLLEYLAALNQFSAGIEIATDKVEEYLKKVTEDKSLTDAQRFYLTGICYYSLYNFDRAIEQFASCEALEDEYWSKLSSMMHEKLIRDKDVVDKTQISEEWRDKYNWAMDTYKLIYRQLLISPHATLPTITASLIEALGALCEIINLHHQITPELALPEEFPTAHMISILEFFQNTEVTPTRLLKFASVIINSSTNQTDDIIHLSKLINSLE